MTSRLWTSGYVFPLHELRQRLTSVTGGIDDEKITLLSHPTVCYSDPVAYTLLRLPLILVSNRPDMAG